MTITLADTKIAEVAMTITKKFNFGVAVKEGDFGTMMLNLASATKKIEIEKEFAKCKKRD